MIEKKYLASALFALVSVGVLSGCHTQTAKEPSFARPGDNTMTCADISREFTNNEVQLNATKPNHNLKNVTKAVSTVNAKPVNTASNLTDQIDLLRNRNALLYQTSQAKKCPTLHSKWTDEYKALAIKAVTQK